MCLCSSETLITKQHTRISFSLLWSLGKKESVGDAVVLAVTIDIPRFWGQPQFQMISTKLQFNGVLNGPISAPKDIIMTLLGMTLPQDFVA